MTLNIWYFCHIQSGARIGRNCVLGQNVNVALKRLEAGLLPSSST